MAIEIRELVIKVAIDENEGNKKTALDENKPTDDRLDEMVNLCVDKVLDVLKEKNER